MFLRFCFVLSIASTALCDDLNKNTLLEVFGHPNTTNEAGESDASNQGNKDELPAADVVGYDKFDWTLIKLLASTSNENIIVSPVSLKLPMAILSEASTGPTRTELASVFDFDLERSVVRAKFATIIESFQKKTPQYTLNFGSKIFIESKATVRQRFVAIADHFYKTELTSIDFNNTYGAMDTINKWCSNITEGRIENLVSAQDVSDAVGLVVNVLFFKGSWHHQFDPNTTKSGIFYATPKVQKSVAFMNIQEIFFYTESSKLDAKILRMPYAGDQFAMYVIVPNSQVGIDRVLDGLSQIGSELNNLSEKLVNVTLPKWNFGYTSHLDNVLKELGLRQAYEDTAAFPGIARGGSLSQRLKLSRVLQKSGIEVNEVGSVVYSATEIFVGDKFDVDVDPVEVLANRPFFFFIQHEMTKLLLFTGTVVDPSQSN